MNLRSRPGQGRVVARLRRGTRVAVRCQRVGPLAAGRAGPSRVWDRVEGSGGADGWLADGYLDTGTSGLVAPSCRPAPPVPPALGRGPCPITAPVGLLPPFASPEALVAAALPGALASREAYGVPVAVTLAQAILETGGGRFTAGANNFFGLKAQATPQPGIYAFGSRAVGCLTTRTREDEHGRPVATIGAFRVYATLEDSILDHGERLAANPVYRAAFASADRPRRFAALIARHYATDPRYAAKLLELMDRYGLEALG